MTGSSSPARLARALRSPRAYQVLGAVMVGNAVADAIPLAPVKQTLDRIEFPEQHRWIFAPIKAAAAIGLFSVTRYPALARLTTAMLTLYFVLAVGFHVRARDLSSGTISAATLGAIFAVMTAEGPSR